MRRYLLFTALVLCFGLSSCQCADKPDIGPVDDGEGQAQVLPDQGERPSVRPA